jgi:hypothetical protein
MLPPRPRLTSLQHSIQALNYSYDRREFGAYFVIDGTRFKDSSQLSNLLNDVVLSKPTNVLLLHKFDFTTANKEYMREFNMRIQGLISIKDVNVKVVICTTDASHFKFLVCALNIQYYNKFALPSYPSLFLAHH